MEYPWLSTLRIMLQFEKLQILTMEVKEKSMHEQLRVKLGKFGKFQRIRLFGLYPKLGKVRLSGNIISH